MRFAIMAWTGGNVRASSVFAIIDANEDRPVLPLLTKQGHWAEIARVDASRFPLAAEALAAIEKDGFYLMGGTIKVTEDGAVIS